MAAATLSPAPVAEWQPPALPSSAPSIQQDGDQPDMAMWPLIPLVDIPRVGTSWLERSRLELEVLVTVASDATPTGGDVRPPVRVCGMRAE